jgi:hypothetical protein
VRSFWLGRVVLSVFVVFVFSGTVAPASAQPAVSQAPSLSPAEIALACAPPVDTTGPGDKALRLMAAQDPIKHTVFANHDLVVVSGGTSAGVQLGQEYFVRHSGRSMMDMGYHSSPAIRTAGWVRIIAVNDTLAIATVDHTCIEMTANDYLEPYVAPPAVAAETDGIGEPDFTSLARVTSAGYDRQIAAPGDFAIIDRGVEKGVAPNMRFAIYRDIGPQGAPLTAIGEVIVISVSKDRALTRILRSNGVVLNDDYAAPRK